MDKVNEYLEGLKEPERGTLFHMRELIKKEVPSATESWSYGMPGFKYKGKYLIGYAAFKDHFSIFPTSKPIESLKEKLGKYKIAKGTVQFTTENQIPKTLLKEILKKSG